MIVARDHAEPDEVRAAVDWYNAGQNLLTPHGPSCYPGITVVRLAPHHAESFICPEDGQTIVALGGEKIYSYQTPTGASAQGFRLHKGDRATRVRSDLPFFLCAWRVVRAR